ncbi:MAG: MFS transporter, partial [Verrucomicrobiota bacterium]
MPDDHPAAQLDGSDRERARLTYKYDRLRAIFYGALEPCWVTLALIIAIRYYEMPEDYKALLTAAGFFGLFFNALSAYLLGRTGRPVTQLISWLLVASAVFIALSIVVNSLVGFLVTFIIGHILITQSPPFTIQIYQKNYRASERGAKLSTVLILTSLGAIVAGWLGGKALNHDIANFPFILVGMVLCLLTCAVIVRRIPSAPFDTAHATNPLKGFSVMWKDKLFGWLLFCWMIIGVTNLLTLPLRVEYMADPRFGINASNEDIVLVTFVIPMIVRLASTRMWGILFDRINFILWRILVNTCFIVAFLIFFNSTSLLMLGLGMGFVGLA